MTTLHSQSRQPDNMAQQQCNTLTLKRSNAEGWACLIGLPSTDDRPQVFAGELFSAVTPRRADTVPSADADRTRSMETSSGPTIARSIPSELQEATGMSPAHQRACGLCAGHSPSIHGPLQSLPYTDVNPSVPLPVDCTLKHTQCSASMHGPFWSDTCISAFNSL